MKPTLLCPALTKIILSSFQTETADTGKFHAILPHVSFKEVHLELDWVYSSENIDWEELSNLYRIAPLGEKKAADLKVTFSNSRYMCFVFDSGKLVGAGRALADGIDCSYICDLAVHPEYQGSGIGKGIVTRLVEFSKDHRKIILYSVPGKETFYKKLGFKRMKTAMAIFKNQAQALENGLVDET
jgi:ribosomal protein S18 acetylase RimI-like enzyme